MPQAWDRHAPANAACGTVRRISVPGSEDRMTVGDAARTGSAEARPVAFRAESPCRKGGRDLLDKSTAG
jgi:hypothetical protein